MRAAFALDYSGPPVPCDFPGCILDSWHNGDHQFAPPPSNPIQWTYDRHCVVCGVEFTLIGADRSLVIHTCGREECLLRYVRHFNFELQPVCCCPQREYPHQLSVHAELRSEWWAHRQNLCWPWSLMASTRVEPSTERKAA